MTKSHYLERYAHPEKLINEKPDPELSVVVTIPAFDEQATERALQSLASCTRPGGAVEVLVLINHPENAGEAVIKRCKDSFHHLKQQGIALSTEKFKIHILYRTLPAKHAGVGLARKIIMDEAVRRFEAINNPLGIITAFDADCTCRKNYLTAVHDFFSANANTSGCSIYFEHPRKSNAIDKEVVLAALEYELHLRCYINGLRWCGVPHAFQTTGSSMAVNYKAYQRQGGMNRRKAGEDFYFLHRIMREEHFGDLTTTTVNPSPRISKRVPFGTGKAVIKKLESGIQLTYNIRSYQILKQLIELVDKFYEFRNKEKDGVLILLSALPPVAKDFLMDINFVKEVQRLITSSSSLPLFRKNFFLWFDGFKTMKYLHYLRINGYADMPVNEAAAEVKKWLGGKGASTDNLLAWFRKYDKEHPAYLKFE